MKKILSIALLLGFTSILRAQDTIWVKFDNRFLPNKSISLIRNDSVEFRMNERNATYPVLRQYRSTYAKGYSESRLQSFFGDDNFAGDMLFENPGRILWHPSTYQGNNYLSDDSQWSFARSMESEHFVVFWEKGFGADPTRASSTYRFNPKTVLQNAEKIWSV
jgi:hypothetical protein